MKATTSTALKNNDSDKKQYQKPLLQKFGTVVQLTAGTNGSATDLSDPFSSQPN